MSKSPVGKRFGEVVLPRSMGYTAFAKSMEWLSIGKDGNTYKGLCPKCRSYKLKWRNYYYSKIGHEESMVICHNAHVTLDENIIVGPLWEDLKFKKEMEAKIHNANSKSN